MNRTADVNTVATVEIIYLLDKFFDLLSLGLTLLPITCYNTLKHDIMF